MLVKGSNFIDPNCIDPFSDFDVHAGFVAVDRISAELEVNP